MTHLLLAAQILIQGPGITILAPPPPPREEAAKILAEAPGISNRTNIRPAPAHEIRGPRVVFLPAPTQAQPAQVAPRPETAQGRAIRMGIPGGWTPLEWAIVTGSSLTGQK